MSPVALTTAWAHRILPAWVAYRNAMAAGYSGSAPKVNRAPIQADGRGASVLKYLV